jgi:hypothetical protein
MEVTVYNPQKGRLETIDAEFTDENTTWFDACGDDESSYMITDFQGGILISECGYRYPVRIYDVSRDEIGHERRKAQAFKDLYL